MKKTMMVAAMAATLAMSTVPAAFASHTAEDVVATGTLTINNNTSFTRDYDPVAYSCGTEDEVVFSSSGDHRVPTSASEGETISGTINTATGVMNWNYVRPGYSSSFVGEGTWSGGTYTFTQDTSEPATGGVLNANGTFTGVPSCASVPSNPADTCKHGGWEDHVDGPFKNQGQCVASYVRNNA